MAELVYPPVSLGLRAAFRLLNWPISVQGAEHLPRTGGCLLASTHTSHLDFVCLGVAARSSKRLVRFMAKRQIFDHRVVGPLMRGMHHVRVDRQAGADSYADALTALQAGEVIGIFPEGTTSRAFEVRQLRSGAARLALASGVPLVPATVWGAQRIWGKSRPRDMSRRYVPISVAIGPPVPVAAGDSAALVTERLEERLRGLLAGVQESYPARPRDAEDAWWLPARLGGTAPTPAEAHVLEEAAAKE